MELFKLSILAFALYAQLQTGMSSEDMDIWSLMNGQGEPAESDFTLRIDDLLKHSKSQQFHGLMGRSLEISQPLQLGQKRNNGEMFVGLMGKRSSQGDFEEVPDKPQ
ncbi:tachykinin-4 isoform X1 [Tachysurus fulvidraco]|uniref:tachykinin-4 isoform X1 n=2 Tax=Tachysurus fulvidraco TaxID=1234273 RepID=UPI001FEF2AC2|nr:tachykinin-4 isoform X1 [Tachysurus fulvidraco]